MQIACRDITARYESFYDGVMAPLTNAYFFVRKTIVWMRYGKYKNMVKW